MENITLFKPLIEQEEIEASKQALKLGWLGMGSFVRKFEQALEVYLELNNHHVVALSTGHAALHLGLLLANVGPGDEVITPSFNNIADFQAILATGAKPVFCDIQKDTLCIDLTKAEKLITPKTKALIVMDYANQLCDHDAIDIFAKKYSLRIIHDAAHSFGSRYKGKMIGSFSDITMFSFDPIKNITCLDGGALVVKNKEDVQKLYEMRFLGMAQSTESLYQNKRSHVRYDVKELGFRYHMGNVHASIGLAQLKKANLITSSRQKSHLYYNERLQNIPLVTIPTYNIDDITPFLYYIKVPGEHRDKLRNYLSENGCENGLHWQPGHTFSLFKDFQKDSLLNTENAAKQLITLPFYSCMDSEIIDRVTELIKKYFSQNNT